jgi:maltooligosyltrehalose trehalohydrolase
VAEARLHRMPFGAELLDDGRVRFRLWAPAAQAVNVLLTDGEQELPMQALSEGWFEAVSDRAQVGDAYRFEIDGKLQVPDPASRFNLDDVQGPSTIVDPTTFKWTDTQWRPRPWHEAVVYELHVGTFSPEGTYAGIEKRLDHLVDLGITTIELMPLADFPGRRGWGYDGVLPFAPDAAYGTPDELKSLINAAHARGLAVMLDVVYNHFGPEGNYLYAYAPQFFTDRHHTPWGQAINFDGAASRTVRDFFTHNALYWLEEYHFDGLRFDAVHAIMDDSQPDFLTELAHTLRAGPGKNRPIYLVLENGKNESRYLGKEGAPETYDGQWNDDVHHCFHVMLTGETDGYYADYGENPAALLCRCLAEGFAYQGEVSKHEGDVPRGEPSAHLPPTAFMPFLQNHDQIGNRAFGDRLVQVVKSEPALRAATAILLLAPQPPLLFMGEEWGAPEPFPFFCDFSGELAQAVREGRRREFAHFTKFGADVEIPDAVSEDTFRSACLNWSRLTESPHAQWLEHYRRLLAVRHRDIAPLIPSITRGRCIKLKDGKLHDSGAFAVDWAMEDGAVLHLLANLTDQIVPVVGRAAGRVIFATHPSIDAAVAKNELAPWSVTWLLERGYGGN